MASKFANPFLVGCDPEFVCVEDNELVNLKGKVAQEGPVGWDHNGFVGEVRPEPAKGTYTLIKRIQGLIQEDAKRLHKYIWRAGGRANFSERNVTLGGHVHLDFIMPHLYTRDQNGEVLPVREQNTYRDEFNRNLDACDQFTKLLVGLDLLDKEETTAREGADAFTGSGYGKDKDIRTVPKGRFGSHIEYRTPISWLYSPKIAFLIMTGIKLCFVSNIVARETLGGPRAYKKLEDFFSKFRDANAARLIANILPDVRNLGVDPKDINVLDAWREVDF